MIRHYFKIALRTLWKHKIFSGINLVGLTVGITACVLIGLFIADEWRFDKFHSNRDRIVRTTMEYKGNNDVNTSVYTGTRVGPRLKQNFPWIEEYVRTLKSTRPVRYQDNQFTEKNILFADSAFFNVFSFPLLSGNSTTVLHGNDKVVLTASAAKKYFGTTDVVGKVLRIGTDKDYMITGVARDVPAQSQLQFDFVINFEGLGLRDEWWTANYITYLLLKENTALAKAQQQVAAYMTTRDVKKEARLDSENYLRYHFEPLTSVHLHSSLDGFEPNGNITNLYILTTIALLILLIACVNYTNLAIAQSAGRNTEIGIRKVMGAVKKQLFTQFMGESFVVTFLALLLAILISIPLLPVMNTITGKQILTSDLLSPVPLLVVVACGACLGLLAGAYPALVLSGTAIIKILKPGFSFSASGAALRKSLIVVQFVISLFLISITMVVIQQITYIQRKELGYNKDQTLIIPIDRQLNEKYSMLKDALKQVPGVKTVSGAYGLPTSIQWEDGITADNGAGKINLSVKAIPVDRDFIETMDMKLVAGSDFSDADLSLMDTSNGGANYRHVFIMNETAVKRLGWTPEQAIGKTIEKGNAGIVKAVVKDFHFASMREPIGPLMIFSDKTLVRNIFLKVNMDNIPALLSRIEAVWKTRVHDRPFNYHFMDEDFNNLYKTERRTATIFSISSGLAIFLACMGLFGLAAFTVTQRTKEIGIRKVLGANVLNIAALISKDFLRLVGYALLIATPIAWLVANKWLQDFAYRIQVEPWIFIAAGLAVVCIALATVSYHAIRAALLNPVKSLRSE
jgi:putative ABC transport system permease protein